MKGLEMVKCESLRINMFRITHTGKSVNFPVTQYQCMMKFSVGSEKIISKNVLSLEKD